MVSIRINFQIIPSSVAAQLEGLNYVQAGIGGEHQLGKESKQEDDSNATAEAVHANLTVWFILNDRQRGENSTAFR
jgi:hypothetical protein